MVSYEGAGSIFFNDQYVNYIHKDLDNIEYTKLKTIRDSLAACIKRPGVAIASLSDSSLKVEYVDAKHFTINPGYAVDKFGRLIYVSNDISQYGNTIDDPEYHPKYPDRENLSHNKVPSVSTRYYVNIYYNTQQDITESDGAGESYYTRIYDSYYIACEDFQAGTSSSFGSGSLGICLGSFEVNTSGNIRFSEITDMRPLLEVYSNVAASGSVPSSRRVFALSRIATNLANALASNNYWAVTVGSNFPKADISYQHRSGSTTMNNRFCVPSYSQPSTNAYVYAYIYTNPGHILVTSGSYNVIVNSQICDFSLDVSGLTPDTLYSVEIWMRTFTGAGTFYVRDLVIDVD